MTSSTIEAVVARACHIACEHEDCSRCHAVHGHDCACDGTHLCRIVAARIDGLVSEADIWDVFHAAVVFTDSTIIPGGLS